VGGVFGNGFIVAKFLYLGYIMLQAYKLHVTVFDLAAAVPDIHNGKKAACNKQGYKATVPELI